MPFGRESSRVTRARWPAAVRRYTPLNGSSLAGSASWPASPYGGSVKYRSPFAANTRSFGAVEALPREAVASVTFV
jgi:hypothetical protein